jgi:hypothetical protein
MDRQGVHTPGKLVSEHCMDRPMAGNRPHVCEVFRNQYDSEMRLGTRRHVVAGTFVAHIQMLQIEPIEELVIDGDL